MSVLPGPQGLMGNSQCFPHIYEDAGTFPRWACFAPQGAGSDMESNFRNLHSGGRYKGLLQIYSGSLTTLPMAGQNHTVEII